MAIFVVSHPWREYPKCSPFVISHKAYREEEPGSSLPLSKASGHWENRKLGTASPLTVVAKGLLLKV